MLLWLLITAAPFVKGGIPRSPKICVPNQANEYDVDWFLTNKNYKGLIEGRALFYTHPLSSQVRAFTTKCDGFYVSIWNVWPDWLYNEDPSNANPLWCVHKYPQTQRKFYENMSTAFARLARRGVFVVHNETNFSKPPMNGIWGQQEFPTLQNWTDVELLITSSPKLPGKPLLSDVRPVHRDPSLMGTVVQNIWKTSVTLITISDAELDKERVDYSADDANVPGDGRSCTAAQKYNNQTHYLNKHL